MIIEDTGEAVKFLKKAYKEVTGEDFDAKRDRGKIEAGLKTIINI